MTATCASLPLFAAARAADLETARAAGDRVRPRVHALHAAVLDAFRAVHPTPLTDRELETRPEFARYAPSTIRKRRSELYQAGALIAVGERDRMTTWALAGERIP